MRSSSVEGQVFERPLPAGYLPAFAFLFLPAVAAALFSGQVSSTAARLAARLPWVDGWSFGWVVHGACIASAGLVYLGCLGWAGRRYGRAVITADHVVVTPLRRGMPPIVVPRDDIVALRETAFGLELTAPTARSHLRARVLPTLIPASDADLARAHELLDPARRVARPFASASSARPSTFTAIGVAVPLWLLSAASAWSANLDPTAIGVTLAAAGALLTLGWLASGVERRRVHLGEETASVGALCGSWSAVRRMWAWRGYLALELQDGRRSHARVGAEAATRLASLARASLIAPGRDELAFADRRPAWVTRRRVGLAAIAAILTAIYVWAGPIAAMTREGCLGIVDHHGHRLRLVYRAHGRAPCLIVIVDPDVVGGPIDVRAGRWRSSVFEDLRADHVVGSVSVDVPGGVVRRGSRALAIPRDATVVHVHVDGVTTSTRPLPVPSHWPSEAESLPAAHTQTLNVGLELLEGWFPGADDPVLRDALDGRTTTRCFACPTKEGGHLYTQVRRGAVRSVVLVDPGRRLSGVIGCGACAMARESPGLCLRSTSDGRFDRSAPLPTLEQVVETQRLLRRNVPVAETPVGRLPWRPR